MAYLDGDGPLRVVDISEMLKFLSNLSDCLQYLLMLKLIIVAAFEMKSPTMLLPVFGV